MDGFAFLGNSGSPVFTKLNSDSISQASDLNAKLAPKLIGIMGHIAPIQNEQLVNKLEELGSLGKRALKGIRKNKNNTITIHTNMKNIMNMKKDSLLSLQRSMNSHST